MNMCPKCKRNCLYHILLTVIIFIDVPVSHSSSPSGEKINITLPNYEDCTEHIKEIEEINQNAPIRFEWRHKPKYYISHGKRTVDETSKPKVVKYDDPEVFHSQICWQLRDCGDGFVCIRNFDKGWRDYFLYSTGEKNSAAILKARKGVPLLVNEYHFKLLCVSCEAKHHCQIMNRVSPYKFYVKSASFIYLHGKIF